YGGDTRERGQEQADRPEDLEHPDPADHGLREVLDVGGPYDLLVTGGDELDHAAAREDRGEHEGQDPQQQVHRCASSDGATTLSPGLWSVSWNEPTGRSVPRPHQALVAALLELGDVRIALEEVVEGLEADGLLAERGVHAAHVGLH